MKIKLRNGFILGGVSILISILIGIFFENDIAFLFAGIGTIIIGISFLAYINRDDK